MRRKDRNGFTLVELMIALFITALTIAGYIASNIVLQTTSEEAHQRTVAVQDANRVIERMRNAAQSGTFPGNVTSAFPQNGTVTGFNNLDSEQVTVTYVNTTANPLDVTVSVTWRSYNRRALSTVLRALITQR